MIAIPAVDLRDGACVQLVGGDYRAERVRLPDPLDVARGWAGLGFRRLHVVDLDAATGRGSNGAVIGKLLSDPPLPTQVGGGVRSDDAVAALLRAGAVSVIVGTRAVRDPAWLERMATAWPGRVVVAADVRGREVVAHGWTEGTGCDVFALLDRLSPLPLGGLVVTAVEREGRMEGPDHRLMEQVARRTTFDVLASGGIASMADLRALAGAGIAGVVLGMALYTGTLEPRAVAEEFVA